MTPTLISHRHFLRTILLGVLIVTLVSPPKAQATSTEKFPTSTTEITAGWDIPELAYAHDLNYTESGVNTAEQEYSGFGFAIPSDATIDLVYVKVIMKFSMAIFYPEDRGEMRFYIKVYNGSDWMEYEVLQLVINLYSTDEFSTITATEPLYNLGFNNATTFLDTPTKVNAAKLRLYHGFPDVCTSQYSMVDVLSIEVSYTTLTGTALSPYAMLILGVGFGFLLTTVVFRTSKPAKEARY